MFRPPRLAALLSLLRVVASLQLAVAVMACFAGVLAWATLVESRYGQAAAQCVVYKAGWFIALNALLALNVLAALLTRLPWQRRQTGFVITHAGILVLLAGCLVSYRYGIEGQLSVFEGHASGRAYCESLHFRLCIDSSEPVDVPFVPGPFSWDRYDELPWFPWSLVYRSRGVIYNRDGVSLQVLDYRADTRPSVRVRLSVDGVAEEYSLSVTSEDLSASEVKTVASSARKASISLRQDEVQLGFQVYLHKFRRKLAPGAGMASHYSSLVDLLDDGTPPQKLGENRLITLNRPLDFTDPRSGRTYRLFQSSFSGPWLPGEAEFTQLAGSDRTRDHVYLSRLSVNYDPGRWLKYLGCMMVVAGIVFVYYVRLSPSAWLPIILVCLIGGCRMEGGEGLDWRVWQRLPAFGHGRVAPLDTFARETVEAICGTAAPVLSLPDEPPRKYSAAELVFSWLAEPKRWEQVAFLPATDAVLRTEVLGLPLYDHNGRRLQYVSPAEVDACTELGRRWDQLRRRAETEGRQLSFSRLENKIKILIDAYEKYRILTFDAASGNDSPQRFYARVRAAAGAWRRLAGDLHSARRIAGDEQIRCLMVRCGDVLQKLIANVHQDDFSLDTTEPLAAEFAQAAEQLAALLDKADDRPTTTLAADLRRQTAELHLALYDNGDTLRLVPALNAGALEEHRTPEDDASPWLSFRAMLSGPAELMQAYPQKELDAVRAAWAEARNIYLERNTVERPARFAAALDRFAGALQTLGASIEPARSRLPILHRDESLLAATAYPPPDSMKIELLYNRLDPFFWSWTIGLAAVLCLLAAAGPLCRPMFWLGTVLLLCAVAAATVGLAARGWITGLVPLTGMFETVMFVALYAALLGLWCALLPLWKSGTDGQTRTERILQRKPFVLAGAIVSFVAAVLAYYAPATVMHRNIGAVAPILRDNFWLAVHVVTIMASYASAAVALILGNMALGYYLFGRYRPCPNDDSVRFCPPERCAELAGMTYAAIRITLLMLAAGTVLGALWADKSWGRFWSWDPKEVWALISLLVYALILHTRYIGWSGDFGMSLAAVLGATAVLFTWYGVNFVLGSGMHAYGSGAGGQLQVAAAVALQWMFLLAAAVRYRLKVGKSL